MYSVLLVALCNSQAQVLFNPNLVSKVNKVDLITVMIGQCKDMSRLENN